MNHINAGKYKHKIEILDIKKVKDSAGFKTNEEEIVILTTYAEIKTTRGYTLIQNDSDFEKAYTNFTIRYPKVNITRSMCVKYNSKRYTIEYLNDVNEEHIELEIQAKVVDK